MNVIIELVLEYLVRIDDVVPFLSVFRTTRHLAERRICQIILETSRSAPNSSKKTGRLSFAMQWLRSYNGTSNSLFPATLWADPAEVVLSEDGWRVRFALCPMNSISFGPGSGVLALSVQSQRSEVDRTIWFRDFSDNDVDLYGFLLDGLWWVENNVCGSFKRNFGSTLSIDYEVSEGFLNEGTSELGWNHSLALSNNHEVDDGDGAIPDQPHAGGLHCERDELNQYFYRFSHLEISVSVFLSVWRDWKAPLKLCRHYPHRGWLGISNGHGIEVRSENTESQR